MSLDIPSWQRRQDPELDDCLGPCGVSDMGDGADMALEQGFEQEAMFDEWEAKGCSLAEGYEMGFVDHDGFIDAPRYVPPGSRFERHKKQGPNDKRDRPQWEVPCLPSGMPINIDTWESAKAPHVNGPDWAKMGRYEDIAHATAKALLVDFKGHQVWVPKVCCIIKYGKLYVQTYMYEQKLVEIGELSQTEADWRAQAAQVTKEQEQQYAEAHKQEKLDELARIAEECDVSNMVTRKSDSNNFGRGTDTCDLSNLKGAGQKAKKPKVDWNPEPDEFGGF